MNHTKNEPSSRARVWMLLRILEQYSDEKHPLSTMELIGLLEEHYHVTAYRTTVYKDLAELEKLGVDLVTIDAPQHRHFLGSRLFETPELKLMIDAIHSSKCLTAGKSEALIDKLLTLTSVHQAQALRDRPQSAAVIKPRNEHIYYIIDAINHAIEHRKRIRFSYTEYSPQKELVLRGDGEVYTLSPYACMWSGDYYYVIGWSDKHEDVVAFRVDRIATTPILDKADAVPPPQDFDLCEYSRSVFQMYSGEITTIELACDNELMKTMIDRFGSDVETAVLDDAHFKVTADVALSPTFYGWLFEFGGKIRLLSPPNACNEYKAMIEEAYHTI